jgi:hypothetical protein
MGNFTDPFFRLTGGVKPGGVIVPDAVVESII